MKTKRLIELKKLSLILSLFFWLILYLLLLKYFYKDALIESYKLKDFYQKYTLYSPILFWALSLIFVYLLMIFKFIFRLKSYIFTMLIYFLSFWFFLVLWIDLMFFEARDADFAKAIINTFSIPLIVSSSITLILVIILSFFKINNQK